MIDSTRSPRSVWRRAFTMLMVATLIAVLAWAIWVKELHHKSPHIGTLSGVVSAGSLVLPAAARSVRV